MVGYRTHLPPSLEIDLGYEYGNYTIYESAHDYVDKIQHRTPQLDAGRRLYHIIDDLGNIVVKTGSQSGHTFEIDYIFSPLAAVDQHTINSSSEITGRIRFFSNSFKI